MLRKLAITVVALLALLVVVPRFVSLDKYKPLIVDKISAQLGRPVQIGAIHAQIIPTLGATVEDVVISNVAGGKAPYLLSLPKASVSVALKPLFNKKIEVQNITLHTPDVQLETLGNGQNNYSFTPTPTTPETTTPDNNNASEAAFSFDSIDVLDARITLLKPAAEPTVIGPFSTNISATSLQGPFTVVGDIIFNAQRFDVAATIGKVNKGMPIDFKSTIGLPQSAGTLDLQGQTLLGDTPQVSAGFKIAFSPLAKLIGAFAGSTPNLPPMIASLETVQGKFKLNNGNIVADNIQIRGPQFMADGAVTVPSAGAIVGNWQLGEVNLASNDNSSASSSGGSNMAAQAQTMFDQLASLFKTKIPALARPFKQTIAVRALAYKKGQPALQNFKATIESDATSLKVDDILLAVSNGGQVALNAAAMHKEGQLQQVQLNVVGQGRNLNNFLKTFGVADNASLAKDFKTNLSIAANPQTVGVKFDDLAFGDMAASNGLITLKPNNVVADIASLTVANKNVRQVQATATLTDVGLKNINATANLSGSTVAAKGAVGNLKDLSGLDIALDVNSQNLSQTMQALGNTSASNLGASQISGTIKGAKADLQLRVQGTLDGGQVAIDGRVQNLKTFDGAVDITHPETATILRNFAKMNPTKNLGAFALKTTVAAGNGQMVADPLQLKLGDAGGLQGKVVMAKNNIDINLEGRTLDLAALTGDSSSASNNNDDAPKPQAAKGWSTTPINLSFLHNASGKVRLKLDNFAVKKFKFEPFELNANVNSGTLSISQLGGGLFDGTANLSGTLKAGNVGQAHQGNFDVAVKDVQVKKFFGSLNSKAFESGVVNVAQNARFNGASQANIISTLNGDGTLQVNDGVLNGFDLDAIAAKMDRFNSLTDAMNMLSQLKAGGTTKFSNLDGKVLIRNGVVTPQNMFMTTEKTRTEFSGQANAPAQYVDMHGLVTFTEQKNMPPLGLVVKGPFSNPYKGLDTGSIENFAKQKLQDAATKKLQNTLQEKLGDKFPFLKQGGTAPAETAPAAETPAPAADDVAPAAEPAPAAKPAPKPEDALKDAANDLLKGALGF